MRNKVSKLLTMTVGQRRKMRRQAKRTWHVSTQQQRHAMRLEMEALRESKRKRGGK